MALIGELTLTLPDGTELAASTDVALAEKWAAHAHGDTWQAMTYGQRVKETADALHALRSAYSAGN